MFYLDSYNKRYTIGRPFEYNGYYYGTALATHEKFIELGFTQVVVGARPDDRFYIVSGPNNDGQYSSTPRDLTELKNSFVVQQKRQAYDLLRGTDWYVIRLFELGTTSPVAAAIPELVTTYRAAVRSASDARCAEIYAVTSIAELEALVGAPEQLYDDVTQTFSPNPAGLTPFPELSETITTY